MTAAFPRNMVNDLPVQTALVGGRPLTQACQQIAWDVCDGDRSHEFICSVITATSLVAVTDRVKLGNRLLGAAIIRNGEIGRGAAACLYAMGDGVLYFVENLNKV